MHDRREYSGIALRFFIFLLLLESSCRLWLRPWSGVYFYDYLLDYVVDLEFLFDVLWDWDVLSRPSDIWKIRYYSVAKYLWKSNYAWFLSYWRRITLNLVFICWFISKYCIWGLRVLQVAIRVMSVYSRPKLGCFSHCIVCNIYGSTVDTCSVLLSGS